MKPIIRTFGSIFGIIHAEYRQLYNRYIADIERFDGNARQIGQQILDRLWFGDFYRTSLGHYNFFWMRDFGTVADALVHLNQTTHVHYTLRWALRHYMKAGRVKLCIDKTGSVFNAPGKPSIDALPWLLHSLTVSNYHLNKNEKEFLNNEIKHYVKKFLLEDGDMKPNMRIAEMRDTVYYDRSAYSIALIGRLAQCSHLLKLNFPFEASFYSDLLIREYWTGDYFRADRSSTNYSSDGALIPFFLKVVDDEKLVNKTLDYINYRELNRPYPINYSETPTKHLHYRFSMGQISMPNYTEAAIWTWHGTFYLHLLHRYRRPEYLENYRRFCSLIERHQTYPELLNADGSWYYAPFYRSDPGMVWVALFMELPEK